MRLFSICVAVLLLSGCAFSVHDMEVGYEPSNRIDDYENIEALDAVAVAEFADERPVNEPNILFHFKNGYGQTTTGGHRAEKPVAEIVRDAFAYFLNASKTLPNGAGDHAYEFGGRLLELEYENITAAFSSKTRVSMTVELELKDLERDEIRWREIMIGRGTLEDTDGTQDAIRQAIDITLQDIFDRLYQSDLARTLRELED